MKLKILIVPVLIVLIIVMAIWILSPEWGSLQAAKDNLNKANAQLDNIKEKNAKAGELAKILEKSTDQRDTLLAFIPLQKQEEIIISNLNSLAKNSSLSVLGTDVSADKNAAGSTPSVVDNTGAAAAAPTGPSASNFSVTLNVAGSYENIRAFLGQVATLGRFNDISSLKIERADLQQASAGQGANALNAEVVLSFNYMPQSNAVISAENEIFSSGSFKMSVVDQIKNKMSTAVNSLAIGQSGASNPFAK